MPALPTIDQDRADPRADTGLRSAGIASAAASPATIALFLGLIGFFAVFMGVGRMDPTRAVPVMDSVSRSFGGIARQPILDPSFVTSPDLGSADTDRDEPALRTIATSIRRGPALVEEERLPDIELRAEDLFDRLGRLRRERLLQLGRLAEAVSDSLGEAEPLVLEIVAPVLPTAKGQEVVAILERLTLLDRQMQSFGLEPAAIRLGTRLHAGESWRLRLVEQRLPLGRPIPEVPLP